MFAREHLGPLTGLGGSAAVLRSSPGCGGAAPTGAEPQAGLWSASLIPHPWGEPAPATAAASLPQQAAGPGLQFRPGISPPIAMKSF